MRNRPFASLCLSLLIVLPGVAGQGLERPLDPVPDSLDGCFATSPSCALCHSGSAEAAAMRDETGASVAPFDLWRGAMMANAARDPLWRAVVSAEVAATPSRQVEIEAKCGRCHMPMAAVEKEHADDVLHLSEAYAAEARHHDLALDGVSCTACHQIAAAALGEPGSWSGHYQIAPGLLAHGPHERPFAMPMRRHTGFTPRHGEQILEPGLCATCHTLETSAYDPDGTATGHTFLEQAPYLEWKNSDFATGESAQSCQDCHVPTTSAAGTALRTAIARNPMGFDFPPIGPRSPFGRHLFVGANTLVPQLLASRAEELKPVAPTEALETTTALARAQLAERTARLELVGSERSDESLELSLAVTNLSGHKFPSAHPIRRAWLHVKLVDTEGAVLFESGGFDERGRLIDAAGEPLPSERAGGPVLPHFDRIDDSAQVQIWSGEMNDRHGDLTHSLLRAASWRKDDRLLPLGWSADGPWAEKTAPVGLDDDPDFGPGGDRVHYRVALPEDAGPLRLEARLLSQTLSARHLAELLEYDTPEVRDLRRLLEATPPLPEVVASLEAEL